MWTALVFLKNKKPWLFIEKIKTLVLECWSLSFLISGVSFLQTVGGGSISDARVSVECIMAWQPGVHESHVLGAAHKSVAS